MLKIFLGAGREGVNRVIRHVATKVLDNYLYQSVKDALASIPDDEAKDVYAISFWAHPEDDDPRRHVLEVSYNTREQEQASREWATDAGAARWNYAYWLQNSLVVACNEEDSLGTRARTSWLNALRLSYSDEEEENDEDRCAELARKIKKAFWEACARVGRRLHDEGIIKKKFGRPIPILIHNEVYDDEVLEATKQANPEGLCDEFAAWIKSQ